MRFFFFTFGFHAPSRALQLWPDWRCIIHRIVELLPTISNDNHIISTEMRRAPRSFDPPLFKVAARAIVHYASNQNRNHEERIKQHQIIAGIGGQVLSVTIFSSSVACPSTDTQPTMQRRATIDNIQSRASLVCCIRCRLCFFIFYFHEAHRIILYTTIFIDNRCVPARTAQRGQIESFIARNYQDYTLDCHTTTRV